MRPFPFKKVLHFARAIGYSLKRTTEDDEPQLGGNNNVGGLQRQTHGDLESRHCIVARGGPLVAQIQLICEGKRLCMGLKTAAWYSPAIISLGRDFN